METYLIYHANYYIVNTFLPIYWNYVDFFTHWVYYYGVRWISKLKKNIGEVIAEAREKKGLSQRQLAKLAKINNSELSKIESGIRKDPSPKILRKISNIIDVNYSDLMYMIGLGLEVTQLNYFVKSHYASLNLEQLDTAEINVLGSIENSESIVSTCKKELEKDDLPEEQKELLIHTIEDHTYQINSSKEIIKLIQSLKVKERNKNAKK